MSQEARWSQAARSKAALEMVHKVYRELMILGFIGFTFIMSKERGLAASPSYIHCFEFCDLMVTIVVFLYTASTAIAAFFMHVSRRQWDRYTLMPTQLVCDKLKEYFEGVDGSMLGKLKHCVSYDDSWRYESDFKMAELLFKQQFHLDRTFDYCLYISLGARLVPSPCAAAIAHLGAPCALSARRNRRGPRQHLSLPLAVCVLRQPGPQVRCEGGVGGRGSAERGAGDHDGVDAGRARPL